jgi:hypothetical protein
MRRHLSPQSMRDLHHYNHLSPLPTTASQLGRREDAADHHERGIREDTMFQDCATRHQLGRREDTASPDLSSALPCSVDDTTVFHVNAAGASQRSHRLQLPSGAKSTAPGSTA